MVNICGPQIPMGRVAVLERDVSATEGRENLSGAGIWEHWNLPSFCFGQCLMLSNLEVRKVTGRNTAWDRPCACRRDDRAMSHFGTFRHSSTSAVRSRWGE